MPAKEPAASELRALAPAPGATMRALAKVRPERGAALIVAPVPTIGPDEALIRVRAASLCGTDIHIYHWDEWASARMRTPRIFGHEFAGEVVALGANVRHLALGDSVSSETHIACGHCYSCKTGRAHVCENLKLVGVDRDGCFAEYVALPAANAWKNDPDLPWDIASIQEPLGNAVHAALAVNLTARTVAITGCGPIGLMAIAIAHAAGASEVIAIEINEFRRELARAMGADLVIDPTTDDVVEHVLHLTEGHGVDVVLEMSGNPQAIRQALRIVHTGGTVSLLGLPSRPVELDLAEDVILKGLSLLGISGREMWDTWYKTRSLLQSHVIDIRPVITHRMPLARYEEAFELVEHGHGGKIVFEV